MKRLKALIYLTLLGAAGYYALEYLNLKPRFMNSDRTWSKVLKEDGKRLQEAKKKFGEALSTGSVK